MNFYIGDLHFFCASQLKGSPANYDNRPFETIEEMHDTILKKWNKKVTNGDTVYILGDVAFRGRNEDLIALVAKLKGKKILVQGNHDDISDLRYRQLFFKIINTEEIIDCFDGKAYKLVVSHFPYFSWNNQHKGTILIYAHLHNTVEEKYFQECIKELNEKEELFVKNGKPIVAINVGCMHPYMDFEPQTLKELLSKTGNLVDR